MRNTYWQQLGFSPGKVAESMTAEAILQRAAAGSPEAREALAKYAYEEYDRLMSSAAAKNAEKLIDLVLNHLKGYESMDLPVHTAVEEASKFKRLYLGRIIPLYILYLRSSGKSPRGDSMFATLADRAAGLAFIEHYLNKNWKKIAKGQYIKRLENERMYLQAQEKMRNQMIRQYEREYPAEKLKNLVEQVAGGEFPDMPGLSDPLDSLKTMLIWVGVGLSVTVVLSVGMYAWVKG